jgi:hypothetical protein
MGKKSSFTLFSAGCCPLISMVQNLANESRSLITAIYMPHLWILSRSSKYYYKTGDFRWLHWFDEQRWGQAISTRWCVRTVRKGQNVDTGIIGKASRQNPSGHAYQGNKSCGKTKETGSLTSLKP